MKAIQVRQFGGPEVCSCRISRRPIPGRAGSGSRACRWRESLRHLHAQWNLCHQAAAAVYAGFRWPPV